MERVRIGCSGWGYDEWRGGLYPEGLPSRRRLERYAEVFDTVEVNATFYRLPKEETVRDWTEQVPGDFRFAVKASRYLTHMKRLHDIADGGRPLLGAARAAAPLAPARPGALAAAGELPARRRPPRRRARPAAARRPLLRVPPPELVRARRCASCSPSAAPRWRSATTSAGRCPRRAARPARLPAAPLRPPRARRQLLGGRARPVAPADRRLALPPAGLRLPQQRLEGLRARQRAVPAGRAVGAGSGEGE